MAKFNIVVNPVRPTTGAYARMYGSSAIDKINRLKGGGMALSELLELIGEISVALQDQINAINTLLNMSLTAPVQTTGTGDFVQQDSPTIITPTIASFINAQHNHENAAGGGQIDEDALALTDVTTNNASTTKHGFQAKIQNCFLYMSANQSLNNTTDTAISFDTESFDNGGFHANSPNPSRLTIPTAGYYLVGGQVEFAANATGIRRVRVNYNGGTLYLGVQSTNAVGTGATWVQVGILLLLAANDYLELMAYQDSGGSLNANAGSGTTIAGTFFSITRLG